MAGSVFPTWCSRLGAVTLLLMLGISSAPGRAAESPGCPADLVAGPARALAHPTVAGVAGPFVKARVTLIGSNSLAGPFMGRLDVADGRCFLLPGPEDPTGLFHFFVKAILFTPLDPGRSNGIVILYDEVHRSPEHDAYPGVLAYRIDEHGAARVPAVEQKLAGARNATQVLQRIAARKH